ncbi:phage/plasmid primase, P4 family [Variovorax sp. GT1P44]|uniref:phage/plasmid primase, P4 family n=1 Tax=Variovorax sp. GT1P44 TaxID=3443742 RepID=UPI003F4892BC
MSARDLPQACGHFATVAPALINNGYSVLPIAPGLKYPGDDVKWKDRVFGTTADLAQFINYGVGVLCGVGDAPVCAVDIDITHPTIGPALIAWCQDNLGAAPERIGAAPRSLLVYRAAEAGWSKVYSVAFRDATNPKDQRVEVLGAGQQFVGYHVHPDTKREYRWVDMFGGLEWAAAASLPLVTSGQIAALLDEAARLVNEASDVQMRAAGHVRGPSAGSVDDLLALVPRVGMPFDELARDHLPHFENDDIDYDGWVNYGMALHHEYEGTDREADALQAWRDMGAQSTKHDPSKYGYKWRSFGKYRGPPVTLRWLLAKCHEAQRKKIADEARANVEQIRTLINEAADSTALSGEVLRKVRPLMPDAPLLRAEIIGVLQQRHKALTGTLLPVRAANDLLLPPRDPRAVGTSHPYTEFGNTERMLDRFGEQLMYVPELDAWYMWTGVYWRKAVQVEIEHLAAETVKDMGGEIDQVRKDDLESFYAWCSVSQQAKMVKNMVALARANPRTFVPAAELDKHSHLLGVRNGAIDLRTGLLVQPDREHRITLVAGCDGDMSAQAPLFEQTVLDAFKGDDELAQYLYRTLGYALMGKPDQDKMIIPFGNGSNGKSTVFGVVRQAFGGYARVADASTFISDGKTGNAGGAREDLVRLRGARFLYVSEPEENGELREAAVKAMTGGDAITARGVYATTSVEIMPTWTVFMPTNHKPIIKGSDNGIWRRLVLMPFDRNFENDPTVTNDPQRAEKLLAELPGILALCVRAALAYQREGLTPPKAVQAARESYRSQMDLLAEWLEDCCDVAEGYSEESNRLWLSWEQFAKSRGILNYVKSSVALGRRLEGRFPTFRTPTGARGRRGVRLKSEISGKTDDSAPFF